MNLQITSGMRPAPGWLKRPGRPPSYLEACWLFLAISILAFGADYFFGGASTALGVVLATASSVTCGLSWLFTRALFQPPNRRQLWAPALVGVLFALWVVLYGVNGSSQHENGPLGFFRSVYTLVSSAMLLLPIVEALDHGGTAISRHEQRFRRQYIAGYGAILSIALIIGLPELARWELPGQVILSLTALAGATVALLYRKRHPQPVAPQRRPRAAGGHEENAELAQTIRDIMGQQRAYLNPDLKVADIARLAGQPEYKVTRCISGDLGYKNFNQLTNEFRIKEAQRRLSDPDLDDDSILAIALDSGFGSIGPFNRAFKEQTGLTPRAFRLQRAKMET